MTLLRNNYLHSGGGGGGGRLNLDQMGMCHGILNLSPCSGVEKPEKYTLFWNQEIMQNYVLYCIVDKENIYALLIYLNDSTIPLLQFCHACAKEF